MPIRIPQSAFRNRVAGFTLVEMLTTVAALIIVMGLAVSLAREVRRRSSFDATRAVLRQLDELMAAYQLRWSATPPTPGLLPSVDPLADVLPGTTDATGLPNRDSEPTNSREDRPAPEPLPPLSADPVEARAQILLAARRNNAAFVGALARDSGGLLEGPIAQIPRGMVDASTLRDAWGNPIVFMPSMHPEIGMAENNRPFFFSPGPDGQYLTRADNLYSYEGR